MNEEEFILLCSLWFVALVSCVDLRQPTFIPPKNPNDSAMLPDGVQRKVLIVGGGLAGMSAALELAERGYNVTIKEKDPISLGGKLATKPVEIFPGQVFWVEHGFHGKLFNFMHLHNKPNIV
jgi:heterodisulfide reductase subunit A-like polyferredoxin